MSTRRQLYSRSAATFGPHVQVGRHIMLRRTSSKTGKTSFASGVVVAMRASKIGHADEQACFMTMPVIGETHADALTQGASWEDLLPDSGHKYVNLPPLRPGNFLSGAGVFDVMGQQQGSMVFAGSATGVAFTSAAAPLAALRPLDRVYILGKKNPVYVTAVELQPVSANSAGQVKWGVFIELNTRGGHPNIVDRAALHGDGSKERPFLPRVELDKVNL